MCWVCDKTILTLLSLSAHLWESTGNMTYLTFADQSISFMYTYMFDNEVFIDT